ncbi:MAG: hypothetical protein M3Q68_03865 [Actinomycetota bacterium]|nr:hypothetical protein [Actinomycetota bacterium]
MGARVEITEAVGERPTLEEHRAGGERVAEGGVDGRQVQCDPEEQVVPVPSRGSPRLGPPVVSLP